MVPDSHQIEFPTSEELRKYLSSTDFQQGTVQKLRDQYVVDVTVNEPRVEKQGDEEVTLEQIVLKYTRNNAPGLKDAIDFLLLPLMNQGLNQNTVKGAIPRPKSDSFEDNMPYFESKLLHRAEPPIRSESPTHSSFTEEGSNRSIFDKLRKPGSSMSSLSSFIDRRRKTSSNSPSSLFMQASNNASKASLVSMESRDSGYRNPWNDSGIDLDHDAPATTNGWGSFGGSASRPNTSSNSLAGAFETKFPFGASGNTSTTSLNTPMIPGLGMINGSVPGDGTTTPRSWSITGKDENAPLPVPSAAAPPAASTTQPTPPNAALSEATTGAPLSTDTTAASAISGYPGPIGPPR